MATETYSLTGDFPNQQVAPTKLDEQVRASSITTPFDGVTSKPDDDVVEIVFSSALTTSEKTTLDGIVATHDGVKDTALNERFVTVLLGPETSVPGALTELSGISEDTTHGVWDSANASFVMQGEVVTAAGTVDLQLVEALPGGPETIIAQGTVGAGMFQLSSTVSPTPGVHEYQLRAQLNSAASATLKDVTLELFRAIDLPSN